MALKIIRTYFKISSFLFPKYTGKRSFKLFQKVRIKSIRDREQEFYRQATKTTIPFAKEAIDYYELGPANGKIVLLVHGWESNAGSLSKFAFELIENNYRVIAFNLPGHAFYRSSSTNLLECYTAMKTVLDYINPLEPISVVSHSLGSAVTANALSRTNYQIERMVFLTSPNKVGDIFIEFKEMIGLNDKAYASLIDTTTSLLGDQLDTLDVETNVQRVNYDRLLIIHDENDRVLGYHNSERIYESNENSVLMPISNVGHYKMLWNDQVVRQTIDFITTKN